jgi:hypothetical protein
LYRFLLHGRGCFSSRRWKGRFGLQKLRCRCLGRCLRCRRPGRRRFGLWDSGGGRVLGSSLFWFCGRCFLGRSRLFSVPGYLIYHLRLLKLPFDFSYFSPPLAVALQNAQTPKTLLAAGHAPLSKGQRARRATSDSQVPILPLEVVKLESTPQTPFMSRLRRRKSLKHKRL